MNCHTCGKVHILLKYWKDAFTFFEKNQSVYSEEEACQFYGLKRCIENLECALSNSTAEDFKKKLINRIT